MRITCDTKDTLPLSALTEFQGGLKKRTAEDTKKIEKSINDYGFATPFFVWKHDGINSVLDGHGRLQTLKEMQKRGEEIPALPVVYIDCPNEAAEKNLLLRICSTYGEMTADSVAAFLGDIKIDLNDLALPDGVLDLAKIDKENIEKTKSTLREQFLVPPFSVLDTRQGYWQDRKKQWKSIGIKSEVGRDNKMLKHLKENAQKVNDGKENTLPEVSIFDPVLCETMYTWFGQPNGTILDPFAGGSVRGIVASYKQMNYTGFDIRPEQIEANEAQKYICDGNEHPPRWILCDSREMNTRLNDGEQFDMIFSCPPYADLEKYSDLDGDISNKEYPQFLELYRDIIAKACSHLKNNRFAVFVVGEVRNRKSGAYQNFVSDTIKAFEDAGLKYYNEIILVNVAGGKAYTAGHDAKISRKIAKVHQNILCFFKTDEQEETKIHEHVLVFLKGDSKAACKDLGDFVADNCVLPALQDDDGEYLA